MAECPYCKNFTANSVDEEIMHMEIAHRDLIAMRAHDETFMMSTAARQRRRYFYNDETIYALAVAYAALWHQSQQPEDDQLRRVLFTRALQEIMYTEPPQAA